MEQPNATENLGIADAETDAKPDGEPDAEHEPEPDSRLERQNYPEGFCPWGQRSPSIMLEFIRNPVSPQIPGHYGREVEKDLYKIDHEGLPFKWVSDVVHGGNTMVDIYRGDPAKPEFKKPLIFVVKRVWNNDMDASRKLFDQEWKITKDLRHPHITAFVIAYEHQARLYLAFYPVARCDLGKFMEHMKANIKDPIVRGSLYRKMYPRCRPLSSESSDFSEHGVMADIKEHYGAYEVKAPLWPLDLDLQGKQVLLRRFFGCLCKALNYLHKTCNIRHKDIKPANILIDESGSVLITDFGISRRFPEDASHMTRKHQHHSERYASPEMLANKERDDSSDTFSLGCVFLEMASLLLGFEIEGDSGLHNHFEHVVNEQSLFTAYAHQLPKVQSWTQKLRDAHSDPSKQQNLTEPGSAVVEAHAESSAWIGLVIKSLDQIERMLSEKKEARPDLDKLWKTFKEISPDKHCEDCMWEPPPQQKENARISRYQRTIIERKITRSPDAAARQRLSLPAISEDLTRTRSIPPPNQVKGSIPMPLGMSQENLSNLSQASLSNPIQPSYTPVAPFTNQSSPPSQLRRPSSIPFATSASTPDAVKTPAPGLSPKTLIASLPAQDRTDSIHRDDGATTSTVLASKSSDQLPQPSAAEAKQEAKSDKPSDDTYVISYDKRKKRVNFLQYGAIASKHSHQIAAICSSSHHSQVTIRASTNCPDLAKRSRYPLTKRK